MRIKGKKDVIFQGERVMNAVFSLFAVISLLTANASYAKVPIEILQNIHFEYTEEEGKKDDHDVIIRKLATDNPQITVTFYKDQNVGYQKAMEELYSSLKLHPKGEVIIFDPKTESDSKDGLHVKINDIKERFEEIKKLQKIDGELVFFFLMPDVNGITINKIGPMKVESIEYNQNGSISITSPS